MKFLKYLAYVRLVPVIAFTGIAAILSGQSETEKDMPQYLFPKFTEGKIILKNKKIETTILNYNTVSGQMVYIKDGNYFDVANPEIIDTVIIQNRKFIKGGKAFYEVLLVLPYPLFVQHMGDLLQAGKPVGYGGTSEIAATEYVSGINRSSGFYNLPIPTDSYVKSSIQYRIIKGDEMFTFIGEKQFLKIFPDKNDLLKQFIKSNKLKIENPEHLIKLVNYLGTLK